MAQAFAVGVVLGCAMVCAIAWFTWAIDLIAWLLEGGDDE